MRVSNLPRNVTVSLGNLDASYFPKASERGVIVRSTARNLPRRSGRDARGRKWGVTTVVFQGIRLDWKIKRFWVGRGPGGRGSHKTHRLIGHKRSIERSEARSKELTLESE